jgi:uncharacterized protein (TIGR03437 family)
MVNAANFLGRTIAPGEIVSIFGAGIGHAQPPGPVLDSHGNIAERIGNTRVLIGGYAAPLLYVSPNRINAVVPFEIAYSTQTKVAIETNAPSRCRRSTHL